MPFSRDLHILPQYLLARLLDQHDIEPANHLHIHHVRSDRVEPILERGDVDTRVNNAKYGVPSNTYLQYLGTVPWHGLRPQKTRVVANTIASCTQDTYTRVQVYTRVFGTVSVHQIPALTRFAMLLTR